MACWRLWSCRPRVPRRVADQQEKPFSCRNRTVLCGTTHRFSEEWPRSIARSRLGGGARNYALQAAIAACHARANTAAETDWERIVLLYDALLQISPSPIVALNRAVAVGMAQGPAAGLHALDALAAEPALANYHLLPSVRGDLLMKLGRYAEAREELQRAMAMTENLREQELLSKKLKTLKAGQSGPPKDP